MEWKKDAEIKRLAIKEYNRFAEQFGESKLNEEKFKIMISEDATEFKNRTYHIDNGLYAVRSGFEKNTIVGFYDIKDQVKVTETIFTDIFKNNRKIESTILFDI